MPEQEYISIAEFAKRANVTKQAVYSRLDSKELTKYVKVETVNGKAKKLISTGALQFFGVNQVKTSENQIQDKKHSSNDLTLLTEALHSKDKTIEALLSQVKQLQEQNQALSQSIVDQGKEMTRLLDQQQQLQAMYARLLLPAPQAQTQETEATGGDQESQQTEETESMPERGQEQKGQAEARTQKKGFFSRFFK